MKFSAHSRGKVEKTLPDVEQVALVLSRIETALPHLSFSSWSAVLQEVDKSEGEVAKKPNSTVEVRIFFEEGVKLSATCKRITGAVSIEDYQFLQCLANEAIAVIGSSSTSVPLFEFGGEAVAQRIKTLAGIAGDVYSTLMFLRSLVNETYENQRLSYSLIISNGVKGKEPLSASFDNKRIKRITDALSTSLVLDGDQNIAGYVALDCPEKEHKQLTKRPWWCAALAQKSKELDGVGLALLRNGDLIVVHDGKLLFSQRAGKWQVWNHTEILARLKASWTVSTKREQLHTVLSSLYHVALDLAFRRSGGLLIVMFRRSDLTRILMSKNDILGGTKRGSGERAIDAVFRGKNIRTVDRRLIVDVASLDGGIIVDKTGTMLAYGAMTKPAATPYQGARSKAAVAASRRGIVIKISSDGHISFFVKGSRFMEV